MHKVIHSKMLITSVQGGTRRAANFVPLCNRIKIKKNSGRTADVLPPVVDYTHEV